jgi:hypothetical protein
MEEVAGWALGPVVMVLGKLKQAYVKLWVALKMYREL